MFHAHDPSSGAAPSVCAVLRHTLLLLNPPTTQALKHSHSAIPKMEVGVAAYNGVMRGSEMAERSPGKGLHVNFTEKGEVKERREKFLTAKYGSHQMSLIRKRLAVEMWLYDELQKLYESSDSSNPEVEVDIDELLDMDDDNQRRRHLQELLVDAKKSPLDVKKFVNDLLERTKTL
ncbi:hypothetical protein GE061_014256 [Apolygus lucorum]|uniref:Uncharacterized protein n=1 Tax=Apolygus lucorum TaxID=248454 RepID=A0A6A4JZR5_APOLU|nr:hypothetical protein GE061_014256 [Apolygus lucorum]